jgi:hypothetical protein
VVGLNQLIGSGLPHLDNSIRSPIGNRDINKQKKPAQIQFSSKEKILSQKKNDSINMDSTIAGSLNARS